MKYNFFDYKDFIQGYHGQDFFGTTHLIAMVVLTLLIIALLIIFRKTKPEKVDKYLKIISIIVPVLEIIKIVWETVFDIKMGHGFNLTGLLPLYTCSLFIYTLPLVAWCKGKVKDTAICWLATIGVFGGLTNLYLTQILNTYPFWTFATFMSLYFHFLMVFTGLFIVVTKYKKFKFFDAILAWIPLAIFSILVIPVCYALKADYMLYYYGNGAPILPDIANFFASHNLRFIYTLIVMFGYMLIAFIFISIYKLIYFLSSIKKHR
jgi:hypothetical protein